MAEPVLKREGNLRFAGIASPGYPIDPMALAGDVRQRLESLEVTPYGAVSLIFSMPPDDLPPAGWECQVGTAITGLPQRVPGLSIEDYRGLYALSLAHVGPIRELPATHRRLDEHGQRLGYRLRPYWRLALRQRRLADGNLLPLAEVSVFLDR